MKSLEMQEFQFENSVQSQRNGLKVGWNSPKGWVSVHPGYQTFYL